MMIRTLALVTLMISSVAMANNAEPSPTPALDNLYPGYPVTVLNSSREADAIYQNGSMMPTGFTGSGFLRKGSECFHRAQIWGYNLQRNYQINAMKVFVFYTHTYKKQCREMKGKECQWWFHVAPYTLVRDEKTQSITEYVLDPTFNSIYADRALEMREWTNIFVETKRKCAEFVPFEKFRNEVEVGPNGVYGREHCYIVRVPATDFYVDDVAARTSGLKTHFDWDRSKVDEALEAAPLAKNKKFYRKKLGF